MTGPRLRVDLHSHTHFSRDGLTTPEEYVEHCLRAGIDCAAVTDHNNIAGALEVQRIAPFRVIIAEEVKTPEGEVIGLFLRDEVQKGMSPEETVRAIREQGGIVVVPHPFDRIRRGAALGEKALARIIDDVDAIEVFNSRTTLRRDNERALQYARDHRKLGTGGSDSHSKGEIGHVIVEMPAFGGRDDFLEALSLAMIRGRYSPMYTRLFTTWAKLRWRLGRGPAR